MKLQHEKIKTITTLCRLSANRIVTGHQQGEICVWDLSLPTPLVIIHDKVRRLGNSGIDSHPKLVKIDENTFASGDYGVIKIWDNKNNVHDLSDPSLTHDGNTENTALVLDKNGNLVSSYKSSGPSNKNIIHVWNLQDYTLKKSFHCDGKILGHDAGGPQRYPESTIVLPDNRIAFSTYNENYGGCAVVIWNPETDQYDCFPPTCKARITGITYENELELIVLYENGTLEKWNIEEKRLISTANHEFTKFGSYKWHGAKKVDHDYVAAISLKDISFLSLKGGSRNTLYDTDFAYFSDPVEHNEIWMKVADDCMVAVNPNRLNSANSLYNYFMGGGFYSHQFDADYDTLLALIKCNYKPEEIKVLSVFSRDRNGMTALHLAAMHDNIDLRFS